MTRGPEDTARSPVTHLAVEAALAAWLAVMIAASLGVGPALFAAIGPILAIHPDRRAGVANGLLSALGAGIGALLGYNLSIATQDALVPTVAVLFCLAAMGTWLRLAGGRLAPFWQFVAIGSLFDHLHRHAIR
jgi:hypothetical protein